MQDTLFLLGNRVEGSGVDETGNFHVCFKWGDSGLGEGERKEIIEDGDNEHGNHVIH